MAWHDMTSHYITSHHITSHYIILYYNMHQDKHLPILVHVPPPCDQGWSGGLLKRWCYTERFLTHCCAKNRYRVPWQSICCDNDVGTWKLFKVVQHIAATNVALKIICRRHIARIDFLCDSVALKIVCRRQVTRVDFLCDNVAFKIAV